MGRVYLGMSAGRRPVAVKIIRRDLAADPEFRERFRREVAAARKVNGMFTAMVLDADVDAPEPWLATAYVAGPSLAEAVHDFGPLPADSVLALAAGLAESLAAIHAADVVHRDLKPSNVLLADDGPRVIDFGISRAAEATSVTRAGFVVGSPGFMSPEQAEGNLVGPPSDMFSLGTILAFAATGESPFGSGSTAALVYRVVHAPARLDGTPAEIRPLIERCLAKEPSGRPTASEFLVETAAVHPMTGWLPGAITGAFRIGTAPAPATPARAVETAVPADLAVAAAAEIAAAAPMAETTGVAQVTAEPSAKPTVPDVRTVTGQAVTPVDEAKRNDATLAAAPEAVTPEPQPRPAPIPAAASALAATPVPETAPTPAPAALIPGLAPSPEAAPMPGDVPDPRRLTWVRRPLAITAAALILIAAIATAIAESSGPGGRASATGHSTASHSATAVSATTPAEDPTSAASTSPSPSPQKAKATARAAGKANGKTTSRSSSPGQPSSQTTTVDAPTAPATAPATTPASSRPAPKPTHSHKAAPAPTHSKAPAAPATIGFGVSGASEESCGALSGVSPAPGDSVSFTFTDNSSADVSIYEVGSGGSLSAMATIGEGNVYTATTAVGDYWMIGRSSGGCLAVFEIDGGGTVTIT
jgi:eukaryotic-like serine/threonine-protein kinase